MLPPHQKAPFGGLHDVSVLNHRLRLFGGILDLRFEWSNDRRAMADDVGRAIRRLTEANNYLLTGKPSHHIFARGCVGAPDTPPRPVFWWREGAKGEANQRLAEEARAKRSASRNKVKPDRR